MVEKVENIQLFNSILHVKEKGVEKVENFQLYFQLFQPWLFL